MALSRIKIKDVIKISDERNIRGFDYDFFGININKEFMPSVANTSKVDRLKYKILQKKRFVFSGMQTGRDNCIRIGMYDNDTPVLVSPAYTTFEVTNPAILPEYFFMIFRSKEMDRYGAFLSDSSVRSNLDWDRFCDIELTVPPIEIQKKYVAIYEAMLDNLKAYENKLEDIKTVFTGLLDKCKKQYLHFPITKLTFERKETNKIHLGANYLYGVGKEGFIKPKQLRQDNSLYKCNVFKKGDLVYNPSVLYAGAIALNTVYDIGICTEEYIVLHVCDEKILKPEFLFAWLKRSECGRFIDFKSVDSVRNRVYYKDLNAVEIPLPPINSQSDFVNIFNCYLFRKKSITKLKEMIDHICPILVKGAVLEAEAQNQ